MNNKIDNSSESEAVAIDWNESADDENRESPQNTNKDGAEESAINKPQSVPNINTEHKENGSDDELMHNTTNKTDSIKTNAESKNKHESGEVERPTAIILENGNADGVIINDSPDSKLVTSDSEKSHLDVSPPFKPIVKKWKWGATTISALVALISFIIVYESFELVAGYFNQSLIVGFIVLVLLAIIFVGFSVFIYREIKFLQKIERVDNIKKDLQYAVDTDDGFEAKIAIRKLLKLYEDRPDLKKQSERVERRLKEVIDGKDLIGLTEVDLLAPIDEQARKLILASSLRVAISTALSPRAFIDMFIIFGENFRLIRKIAELYSSSPGKVGMYRLIKRVVFAIAFAGAVEAGSTLITEILGVSMLTKLTRKAGEGVANGILTIRIGLAIVNVCRPCPIVKTNNFKLSEFVKSMFTSFQKKIPEESKDTKN